MILQTIKKAKYAGFFDNRDPVQITKRMEKEVARLSESMTQAKAREFLSKLSMYDKEGRLRN